LNPSGIFPPVFEDKSFSYLYTCEIFTCNEIFSARIDVRATKTIDVRAFIKKKGDP